MSAEYGNHLLPIHSPLLLPCAPRGSSGGFSRACPRRNSSNRVQRETGPKSTIQEARESAEREHILRALEESKWNVSGAARALGMERTNLHKRIRALGLSREK